MIGKLSSTYRYWKKRSKYLTSLPDNLEVVNTGSTPFYRNFDYKLWKCKGGNLAFQPQPLYYDIETLKKYKDKLAENFNALMGAIVKAKPAAAKGQYLRSVTVASTMGPGIKINSTKIDA